MNINKIIIGGRLTDDPEIRMTTGDIPVCKFTVAVNRGGKEPKADFINCVAFRRTAEFVGKWFRKGRSIVVMGSMRSSFRREGRKKDCLLVACRRRGRFRRGEEGRYERRTERYGRKVFRRREEGRDEGIELGRKTRSESGRETRIELGRDAGKPRRELF